MLPEFGVSSATFWQNILSVKRESSLIWSKLRIAFIWYVLFSLHLSGFLISSVTKLRVSHPEYENRAEYRARAMCPASWDESSKSPSKFCVWPGKHNHFIWSRNDHLSTSSYYLAFGKILARWVIDLVRSSSGRRWWLRWGRWPWRRWRSPGPWCPTLHRHSSQRSANLR